MLEPQFSVVIACYNQENFVREAVDSVLVQAGSRCEVIAVDDASRDGTADVLRGYGSHILFARPEKNLGASGARNFGASLARGEYLVFLDGDDALAPWALDVYESLVQRRPEMILAHSRKCQNTLPEAARAEAPDAIQFAEYPEFLEKDRSWVYNSSSLIVRRKTFLAAGGWTQGLFYQDIQDLLLKLSVAGKTILVHSPETVWYRMHGTNAVGKVQPFVEGIFLLLAKARRKEYPGDGWRRAAWLGGLAFYWCKTSLTHGLPLQALRLLARTWWMIGLAALRRARCWVAGRSPLQKIQIVRTRQEASVGQKS